MAAVHPEILQVRWHLAPCALHGRVLPAYPRTYLSRALPAGWCDNQTGYPASAGAGAGAGAGATAGGGERKRRGRSLIAEASIAARWLPADARADAESATEPEHRSQPPIWSAHTAARVVGPRQWRHAEEPCCPQWDQPRPVHSAVRSAVLVLASSEVYLNRGDRGSRL
jgi:hypothetical protein